MAKVLLGRYAEKDLNFSVTIEACMKRKRIDAKKLSKRAGIAWSTHYKRLKEIDSMRVGELREYINILYIPEEDVLSALYLHREKR